MGCLSLFNRNHNDSLRWRAEFGEADLAIANTTRRNWSRPMIWRAKLFAPKLKFKLVCQTAVVRELQLRAHAGIGELPLYTGSTCTFKFIESLRYVESTLEA